MRLDFPPFLLPPFPLPIQPHPSPKEIPPPKPCPAFVEDIRHNCVAFSDDGADRLLRGHGNHLYSFTCISFRPIISASFCNVPFLPLPLPLPLSLLPTLLPPYLFRAHVSRTLCPKNRKNRPNTRPCCVGRCVCLVCTILYVCITYGGGVVFCAGSHEDVESIVQAAAKHNVVIIPYGGT